YKLSTGGGGGLIQMLPFIFRFPGNGVVKNAQEIHSALTVNSGTRKCLRGVHNVGKGRLFERFTDKCLPVQVISFV
ncbi:TPA: hypothetical protein ACF1H3_004587, partial [Salmonella enterica]